MKITESRLRQIVREELVKLENFQTLLEQSSEEDEAEKPDPAPEEISRLMKAVEPFIKDSPDIKSKILNALKHEATPSETDNTSKDDQILGQLLKKIIKSENPSNAVPLFTQLKKMASKDKVEIEKQEKELEKQEKQESEK